MPKQKPIRTTLYLPSELWRQCRLLAVNLNTTATDIVVRALEAYVPGLKAGTFAVAKKTASDAGKKAVKDAAIEARQEAFVRGLRDFNKGRSPRS